MPKPMLGNTQQTQSKSEAALSISIRTDTGRNLSQEEKMKLDRLLRKPRSKEYMDCMKRLDAGGHVHNKHRVDEIVNGIREEFPEVTIEGIMLGIVSICYLGAPYEVHTLDMTGSIIEHFKVGQPLKDGLEKARSIAIRGGYEFVEVYVDCCRAVSSDGSVSVIKG